MNDEKTGATTLDDVSLAPATSRKITNTKPNHGSATANVRIHGLSLLCTNARDNTVEIGFFRHGHTPVCICIDGPSGPISFPCDDGKDYTIVIERAKPQTMGEFYHHPKSRNQDIEDFRWMPDLLVMHPRGADPTDGTKQRLSAKLVIRDGIYYTNVRSQNPARLWDTAGHVDDVVDYVGRVLGVDLTCDPNDPGDDGIIVGVFEKNTPTPVFESRLPRSDGRYTINVETISLDSNEDHMPMLYRVIDAKEHSRFSLRYDGEDPIEYCGCYDVSNFVGYAAKRIFYRADAPEAAEILGEERVEFKTFREAVDAGFSWRGRSDQYACQSFPGGEGPILYP